MPDLYLDHAATSPPLPEALAAFADACARGFANPGSLHQKGADAARILQAARKDLKKAFGADSYQVIWTGTGTEANHLGIQGFARAQKEKMGAQKILIGAAEHPAARMAAMALEKEGFEIHTGRISLCWGPRLAHTPFQSEDGYAIANPLIPQ